MLISISASVTLPAELSLSFDDQCSYLIMSSNKAGRPFYLFSYSTSRTEVPLPLTESGRSVRYSSNVLNREGTFDIS